jgi:hypothetical protein
MVTKPRLPRIPHQRCRFIDAFGQAFALVHDPPASY